MRHYFIQYVDISGLYKAAAEEAVSSMINYLNEQKAEDEYYIILPTHDRTEMQYLGIVNEQFTYYINFYIDKLGSTKSQIEVAIEELKNRYSEYFLPNVKVRYFTANCTNVQFFMKSSSFGLEKKA